MSPDFLGAANILEGRVAAGRGGGVQRRLPAAAGPQLAAAFALRPERIRLVDRTPRRRTASTARLQDLAYRGDGWLAVVALPGGAEWRVALPADAPPPAPGAAVALAWAADEPGAAGRMMRRALVLLPPLLWLLVLVAAPVAILAGIALSQGAPGVPPFLPPFSAGRGLAGHASRIC